MHIACAVTTAPRRVAYLDATLQSLVNAGFDNPLVVRDGEPRLGIVPTFRKALWLVRDAPLCLVAQDDIALPAGLRLWLMDNLPAERGVFALYLSRERFAPDGWSKLAEEGYPINVGACAFLFDRSTVNRILDSEPFQRVDVLGSQLALWCRRNSVPFWLRNPSLVKHVGDVSCREIKSIA